MIDIVYILYDFNPHSRTGSDIRLCNKSLDKTISIHTPAQGVTAVGNYDQCSMRISIHTPAQGVTSYLRSKAGGVDISIHTPAQGVTVMLILRLRLKKFQSTLPHRE